MKTRKPLALLLCVLLAASASSLRAAEEPNSRSNTMYSSSVLQITGYLDYREADELIELLNSIAHGAIRERLQAPLFTGRPQPNYSARIEGTSVVNGTVTGKLLVEIQKDSLPPIADEIRDEVFARIQTFLDTSYEIDKQVFTEKAALLEDQANRAQAELKELEAQLLKITGGQQMDRGRLEETITRLTQEQQEADFRLQATDHRRQNLANQLNQAKKSLLTMKGNDTILGQLQEKVNLMQQRLELLQQQQKAGVAPEADVLLAQQQLIDTRIELAKRQEALQTGPEAQQIRQLEESLADLSMEISEQQMRFRFLHEQINRTRQMLEHSTEYKTLRIKSEVRQDSLYESIEELEEIRNSLAALRPPRLVILSK